MLFLGNFHVLYITGFQYGVTSCTLSKCDIKDAILWQSFSNMIRL